MDLDFVLKDIIMEEESTESLFYVVWSNYSEIPTVWNRLVANHDLFLSTSYFAVLEKAAPKGMKHHFIGFYKGKELIGCGIFQLVHIKASEAYRPILSDKKNGWSFIQNTLKKELPKLFNLNVLVGGNLMLTGEHSHFFDFTKISEKEAFDLWFKAVQEFKAQKEPTLTLLKDFFEYKTYDYSDLVEDKFHPFTVEPNMILHLKSDWYTFSDYQDSMKKKYRARVKTARKKIENILIKELSYEEIISYKKPIHELYLSVSDNSNFNTFLLDIDYFSEMKKHLKSKFQLNAYFLEDKIVGFYTVILNERKVVTHFLGYCSKLNRKYQLYLNMLFDMAEIGINERKKEIIYARTALEIKSTVGAEPYQMKGFMKHKSPVVNKMAYQIFKYLKPEDSWVQRKPFK